MTATITRDAQTEWLECFFGAQAHRVVRDISPWINLPPFAILAQTPVECDGLIADDVARVRRRAWKRTRDLAQHERRSGEDDQIDLLTRT